MNTVVTRFTSEIEYLRALARMYEGNGETEVSRSALEAARAVERLLKNVIDQETPDEAK